MANEQNLIPFTSEQSREEAKKNGRKGGIASGEAKRANKSLMEGLKKLMSLPIQDESTKEFIRSLGYDTEDLTNGMAINVAMFQEALKGNVKAYELIRDTLGEKPTDKISVEEAPQIVLKRPEK